MARHAHRCAACGHVWHDSTPPQPYEACSVRHAELAFGKPKRRK